MKNILIRRICIAATCAIALVLTFYAAVYFVMFRPNFTRRTGDYTQKQNQRHWGNDDFQARNAADTAWWENSERIRMEITSYDGLSLVAYYLPHEEAKGIVLMMHGFQSTPTRDFASIARWYYEAGYTICLPFQRNHGESEGTYITFGVKERYDVRDWVQELNDRFGMENDLWIHGISMGCATVLMASGFSLPFNVRGIIADCGFTSPKAILLTELRTRKLPLAHAFLHAGNFFARHLADFTFTEYDTFQALRTNETPVLFIHGTKDDFVPPAMTIANYEFCHAPKELLLVEDAIHAISFYQDEALYTKTLTRFLTTYALPR